MYVICNMDYLYITQSMYVLYGVPSASSHSAGTTKYIYVCPVHYMINSVNTEVTSYHVARNISSGASSVHTPAPPGLNNII